jgi:chromosome segregation ATPase
MKKALSVALLLGLLTTCIAATAQEEITVPELFEREIAAMEEAFGGVQAFMAELIGEVKGNMADIDELQAGLGVLRDYTDAIATELGGAQEKIAALQSEDEALMARIQSLKSGLDELTAFAEECCARLEQMILRNREEFTTALEGLAADLAQLESRFSDWAEDYAAFKQIVLDDLAAIHISVDHLGMALDDLQMRVQCLEDEDVGSFKRKVIELERNMAALSIKVDNNRTKLEGFDHALASLTTDIELNASGLLSAMSLIEDHEARLALLEQGPADDDLEQRVSSASTLALLALLAGIGALVWSFVGG